MALKVGELRLIVFLVCFVGAISLVWWMSGRQKPDPVEYKVIEQEYLGETLAFSIELSDLGQARVAAERLFREHEAGEPLMEISIYRPGQRVNEERPVHVFEFRFGQIEQRY
jgi:hypothetical protein